MQKDLQELIEISRYYGKDKRFIIAGGGNTSMKTHDRIWIKASGFALSDIVEDGFAVLDRSRLQRLNSRKYPEDPFEREKEIKDDLMEACISKDRRPSVETSLHDLLPRKFVVHLHPTLVNGLMCGNNAGGRTEELFGEDALYIPYTDPGYMLFKEVERRIGLYRTKKGRNPEIILLQNHGIFVGAETTGEIRAIYDNVFERLKAEVGDGPPEESLPVPESITEIVPALRMMLSEEGLKILRIRNTALIRHFSESAEHFNRISRPLTPNIIVYCKSSYMYSDAAGTPEEMLRDMESRTRTFKRDHGYLPKVMLVKGFGLIAAGDNAKDADIILDVFEDMMKISWLSDSFGGPHFMTDEQIQFIDT